MNKIQTGTKEKQIFHILFLFSLVVESKPTVDSVEQTVFITNPQNYIVYTVVTSIVIYILIGIYLSRKEESTEYFGRKHSISSRRGR